MVNKDGSMYYIEVTTKGQCVCCNKETNRVTLTLDGGYMCSDRCDMSMFYRHLNQNNRNRKNKKLV